MSKIKKSLKEWCIENNRLDLLDEWDYDKNDDLTPDDVSYGTKNKYYWTCSQHHSYDLSPKSRTGQNQNCPYCSNHRLLQGYNDLEMYCRKNNKQHILDEWNYEENKKLGYTPQNVTPKSSKQVYWKCQKGHSYPAKISNKVIHNSTCPYCSNKKVLKGYNDLETYYKKNNLEYILSEYNYNKNIINPDEILYGSHTEVWWKCSICGHEFHTQARYRLKHPQCPVCQKRGTSFPEQAIIYYISQKYSDIINSHKSFGFELDIYIPSIKTAIEYDGLHWHSDTFDKDNQKNINCQNNGIKMIRIREETLCSFNNCICIFNKDRRDTKMLDNAITELCAIIGINNLDIDTERDKLEIINNYKFRVPETPVSTTHPHLLKEWHSTKNGQMTLDNFSYGSSIKVWWLCPKCGYEWFASVGDRTSKGGTGCPCCANKVVVYGINDLETYCVKNGLKHILEEWDYKENDVLGITPQTVVYGSNTKVYWKCKNGHKWKVGIRDRTIKNHKCNKCVNYKSVRCIETGEMFESGTLAAKHYNLSPSNVLKCCKEKHRTSGGYHWEYVDEE